MRIKLCMPNLFPVPPSKPEQKVLSRTTAVVWPHGKDVFYPVFIHLLIHILYIVLNTYFSKVK